MKPPINTRQSLASSDKTKVIVVMVFLAILLLLFGLLVGLLLRQSGFKLPLQTAPTQAISTFGPTSVPPTMFVLTPLVPLTPGDSEATPMNPSQLDLIILASTVSTDQATVTLDIQLTNQGRAPITLTANDVSITPENGNSAPPSVVTPPLPQEILPGKSLSISVSFSNPKTTLVTLRILDLTENYPLP